MPNLHDAALILGAESTYFEESELFMDPMWFGLLMFALLLLGMLVTVSFSSRGKQLPAQEHEGH